MRSRVLNTLLVMLFVFRLVCAPRRQGYTDYRCLRLWAQVPAPSTCPKPQPAEPVSDAAQLCKAPAAD